MKLALDDVWPRDLEHRYRLYIRTGRELTVLAACPEPGGLGLAITTLHAEGALGEGQFGVLDVMPNAEPAPAGEWIVSPFNRSEEA